MRSVSGREFIKLIERHGWALLRVQGSHHIYGKSGVMCDYPSLYMATRRSRPACSGT